MNRNRAGFTVVELLIVMIIGSVLATIVSQSLGAYLERRALDDSRAALIHMAARARSLGVDRGLASLDIDPAAETATLVQDGDTLAVVNLETEYGTDLLAASALSICYGPSGFALSSCTSFTANQTIGVRFRNATARLRVRPLGQIELP
jgi:prepilin-type N-terminal cleavage/methylation domain-containing protein